MALAKKCIKIIPLKLDSRLKCGVCDDFLVIPPIYSCLSVKYICGPCFEGYRYYLDNDDLRGADQPIRQILYENYACRIRFPCSFYPFCQAVMEFDKGAKMHYKEYCMARILSIFKCPISKANRWFLRPTQKYCQERFKGNLLYENENLRLMIHLKVYHGEYLLDKPYILYFKSLKADIRRRQLFLLLIEENSIVAVVTTEITKNDIVFRCRVNDSADAKSQEADPFECYVSLWPPHERFSKSVVNLKFGCVQFDHEDIEYPWQSLRLPLRHLMDETVFKFYVAPRSHLLNCLPFILRDRHLCDNVEEDSASRSSEATTLSNPESAKTEIELLSFPSTNSDNQVTEFDKSAPEIWGVDTNIETQDILPTKNDDDLFLGVDGNKYVEEYLESNVKQLQEEGGPLEKDTTDLISLLTPDSSMTIPNQSENIIFEEMEGTSSPKTSESNEDNIECDSCQDRIAHKIKPVSRSLVLSSDNISDSDKSPESNDVLTFGQQDNYDYNEISIEHNYTKTICMNSQEYNRMLTSKLEGDHSNTYQIQEEIKSTSDNKNVKLFSPENIMPHLELAESESSSDPALIPDDPPELTPIFNLNQDKDKDGMKRTKNNSNDSRVVDKENLPHDTNNEFITTIFEEETSEESFADMSDIKEEVELIRIMTLRDKENSPLFITEREYSNDNEYTEIEETGKKYSAKNVLENITNVCNNKGLKENQFECFCMKCTEKKNRK